MTRAILHVGMHKTGSTFLQNTLFANREALLGAGVLYPLAGLHLDSPQAGHRHLGLRRSLAQEGPGGFAATEVRAEVAAHDCHTVFISYEGFFTPDTNAAHLREALDGFDVTVLLYLRDPVDYLESKYREWVRLLNDTGEIEQFLDWQWPFLDVLTRAEEWEKEFGREQMEIRSYDRLDKPTDLLDQAMALIPGLDLVLEPDPNANPGPTNEYTLAKLMANRLRLAGTPIPRPVVTDIELDYGSNGGRLFSDDAVAKIEQDAGPEFSALLERYGQGPRLESKRATAPRDEAFFDPDVRASVVQQLRDGREQHIATTERRARQRAKADAAARRAQKKLEQTAAELDQATVRTGRLEKQLQQARSRHTETKQKLRQTASQLSATETELRATESRVFETETRLYETEAKLNETESRREQTMARLETVQARLQRATAQRSDLQHRLQLAKVWRVRNWPAYASMTWKRVWQRGG